MVRREPNGMTLMSVLVATALSGIIGLMMIRLIGNQAEAMLVVKLYEEREILIKHYRQVVIGGWDKSMASTTTPKTIYTRRGQTFPFSLKKKLYTPLVSGVGWWEINARIGSSTSGKIQHSDAYDASGSGLDTEKNYTVTLSVDFDPTKHPNVEAKIAAREEIIYMGYRWQKTKQSGCGSDSVTALTRRDTTGTSKPLYHPNSQGAVVSYSFHSNYIKCSQVPLVSNVGECPAVSGILGFESRGTGTSAPFYRKRHQTNEYVTGRLACSYPIGATNTPGGKWKTALGGERYYTLHNKVWYGSKNKNKCSHPDIKKSYVDFVTVISSDGTGGGRLSCESALIAPQVFRHYYDGVSIVSTNTLVASSTDVGALGTYPLYSPGDAGHPAGLNECESYSSYDEPINKTYDDHVGGGGYKNDHSGGLTKFTSTGSGSGARTDPFNKYSDSRGIPGDRGPPGECICGQP